MRFPLNFLCRHWRSCLEYSDQSFVWRCIPYRILSEKGKRVDKQRKRAENVSMWQTNLIKLYCAVCDHHSTIEAVMQRQSNNFRPQFSDEECITVYLWGISQRRFEQKTIYNYTKNHLLDWFPKLPSYQA